MILFNVNHAATGKYFMGRKREIAYLQKHLFDEVVLRNSPHISLTGMNRIGKTSLLKEMCTRFQTQDHPGVYVLETSLEGAGSFWKYWINSVIHPLLNQIQADDIGEDYRDTIEEIRDYFQSRDRKRELYSNDPVTDEEAKEKISMMLKCLEWDQKAILLVMDEFDKAAPIFGTQEENFGWFRRLLEENCCLSVITMSRRSIYYIEQHTFGGSTLHGIFTKYPLFGFSNEEIDLYFQRIEEAGAALTQHQKEKIWYYCGRSPHYLAIMAEALLNADDPAQVDIQNVARAFYDSFQAIVCLLKEEKMLTPMLEMFVGPRYTLRNSDIEKLASMGYCMTKSMLDEHFDRADYCDYFHPDDTSLYLTVCDHFVDYLSDTHQAELEDIWPKLSHTEKKLRKIIEIEYKREYGSAWKDELNNLALKGGTDSVHTRFLEKHELLYASADHQKQLSVGNSALNVISVSSLGYIIRTHWNDWFKKYFHISKQDFKDGIDMMYDARNPISHSNGELLSISDISDVEDVCNEFVTSIEEALEAIHVAV